MAEPWMVVGPDGPVEVAPACVEFLEGLTDAEHVLLEIGRTTLSTAHALGFRFETPRAEIDELLRELRGDGLAVFDSGGHAFGGWWMLTHAGKMRRREILDAVRRMTIEAEAEA